MVLSKNYTQLGRNMIEMLGVLAIVGVLSVGGIAGYNKAMTKIHINQAIQQISQIAMGVQTLYKNQKVVDNLTPDVLKKAGIIDVNTDTSLYNSDSLGTKFNTPPVGSWMLVYTGLTPAKSYNISLYDLSEEECIALFSYDWTLLDGFHDVYVTNASVLKRAYAHPTGGVLNFVDRKSVV